MSSSHCSIAKALFCCVGVLGLLLGTHAALCQGRDDKDQPIGGGVGTALVRQSWSTEDGLPQNSVHAILQTHDGFLWIATEGGLARFDGLNFRIFQQANELAFTSDDICCLAEDSRNDLWIGTADGLVHESRGVFKHFGVANGLPSPIILDVVLSHAKK